MNEAFRALVRRQLDLEQDGRALGAARYRANRPLPWRSDPGAPTEEAELPPGKRLLRETIKPTAEAIQEFLEGIHDGRAGRKTTAAWLFLLADPEAIAYLTARVVINASASGLTLQKTSMSVADGIIDHVEMLRLKEKNRPGYQGLIRSQEKRGYSRHMRTAIKKLLSSEDARVEMPMARRLQAGMKAIELLIGATGFFSIALHSRSGRAGKELYVIRPTEAVMQWLEQQHARSELLEPVNMPMVVRPKRWRNPFVGGYLTRRPGQRLVKQRIAQYHEDLKAAPMEAVYAAVNAIQEVPWRINRRVLDVLEQVWDGGGSLGGLPSREDDPLPARPNDIDQNELALKVWKREAAVIHDRNARNLSSRLAMAQRLWVSRKFAEEEAIYFPHDLDFRGRVYPQTTAGPTPQGDDVGKALLEFAEGKPLGESGGRWLAIHIANLFGVDKVSFDERVAWVYDHSADLIDSALAPLDGNRFWTTADSPYMALAAVFEWVAYLDDKNNFVSHLPIALDGSNSGLQHFSALLRDPIGAAAVNLAPNAEPADIYKEVASRAQAVADASSDPEAAPWKGGKITRAIAKRPTMTFVYSATRFGMVAMIVDTLRSLDASGKPHLGGADNYAAANWLSYVLYEAIQNSVSAAAKAMDWLREAARIASASGRPLQWTTPLGLPVVQGYREALGERVRVHWQGRQVKMILMIDGSVVNKRAQANGIAPNFVHSLDASHLMRTVLAAREAGINSIAVIHDSFGTHAADTDKLAELLKLTFIEQYTPDILSEFYQELKEQLPPDIAENLPPPPASGTFDLSEVRRSAYIFA